MRKYRVFDAVDCLVDAGLMQAQFASLGHQDEIALGVQVHG